MPTKNVVKYLTLNDVNNEIMKFTFVSKHKQRYKRYIKDTKKCQSTMHA
jgi:hypothetical protein